MPTDIVTASEIKAAWDKDGIEPLFVIEKKEGIDLSLSSILPRGKEFLRLHTDDGELKRYESLDEIFGDMEAIAGDRPFIVFVDHAG